MSKPIFKYFAATCLSIIIISRPTLLPAVLIFLFFLQTKPDRYFLAGIIVPVLLTLFYLLRYDLIQPFFELQHFNTNTYTQLATKIPDVKSAILIFGCILLLLKDAFPYLKRRPLITLLILTSLLPVYPRFGLEHLQPFLYLTIITIGLLDTSPIVPFLQIGLLGSLLLYKLYLPSRGNYYLDADTATVAKLIASKKSNFLYIFGGNDLIYTLANKLPPNNTYIPSLPWYLAQKTYTNQIISSLASNPSAPVLVNTTASVDGHLITVASSPIYQYIQMHYHPGQKIGRFQLYESSY